MAYIGDIVSGSRIPFDLSWSYTVVVSGATWNPCGHMLLNIGGKGGWYCHVAEVRGRPRCMSESGYRRYLHENKKQEIRRSRVPLENPKAAQLKLEELLRKNWNWFILPNNCVGFVEEVLQAGGTKAGLYSNCPMREKFR